MLEFNPINVRTWSMLGSCGAFGIGACELAEQDEKFVVATADLCSFSGLERLRARHPDRIYNVGIAEQNLIGVAAGMAKEGFNVFCTTYAAFASTRCLDQVKVNMGYMRMPIKLVGLTSGFAVGILGATHICAEDLAVMRALPGITVLSPADGMETVKAIMAAAASSAPVYLRLSGGMNSPVVYRDDYAFEIGRAVVLREGADVAVLATGPAVYASLKAAELLDGQGLSCRVVDVHTIKPLDAAEVHRAGQARLVVAVEEHSVIGGLAGAIAETLAAESNRPPLLAIGMADGYPHAAGYEHLMETSGLTPRQIAEKIAQACARL